MNEHNLITTRLRFSPNEHKRLPGVYFSPLIQPSPCYNRVWRLSWCCLGLLLVPQSTGHTLPQSFPLWTPCSPPPSWLSVPWHSAKVIILSVILSNKFTKVTQNTSKSSCSIWFRHLGLNTTFSVRKNLLTLHASRAFSWSGAMRRAWTKNWTALSMQSS